MLTDKGNLNRFQMVETLLESSRAALKNPKLRSCVTVADFYQYAFRVWRGPQEELSTSEQLEQLRELAKQCRFPPMVSASGNVGLVLVSTPQEGKDNIGLCWDLAANLQIPQVNLHVPR